MTTQCPQCGDELEIPPGLAGGPMRCGSCRHVFVPLRTNDGPTLPRPRPSAAAHRAGTGGVWGVALLTLLLTVPCTVGCVWAVIALALPDFRPVSDETGRFAAAFPGDPIPVNRKDADDRLIRGLDLRRDFPPEKYFVYYLDLPEAEGQDPQAVLAKAAGELDGFIPPGCEESRREPTAHDGFPALDLEVDTDDPQAHKAIVRLVLGKAPVGTPRLYVAGLTGNFGPDDIRSRRFFLEFRLKR